MRYLNWVLFLLVASGPGFAAEIDQLAWMSGKWHGQMGPQAVEEAWSVPEDGVMTTMIKLTGPQGVSMIELIVIRQSEMGLMLHLRQFSPALELRLAQDMRLQEIGNRSVSFVAAEGAAIKTLAYSRSADILIVELSFADGNVFAVELVPA